MGVLKIFSYTKNDQVFDLKLKIKENWHSQKVVHAQRSGCMYTAVGVLQWIGHCSTLFVSKQFFDFSVFA